MTQLIGNQIRRWIGRGRRRRGGVAIRTISFSWTCRRSSLIDRVCHFSTAKQLKGKDLPRFFESDMTWIERNFSLPFVWPRNDWLNFLHRSHSLNNDCLRHVFPYSIEIRSSYPASDVYLSLASSNIYLLIYIGECLSVCLIVLYAFRHNTCQCSLTFQESSFHPGEGCGLLFSPKLQVLASQKDPSSVSNQWNCSISWYVRGQAIWGFRGRWVRIWAPFEWKPIDWLRTNSNTFFEKFVNLNGIVAETVLEGSLGASMGSNLMFIRLEIVLVKLEPISDKHFNPFRPAIR